MLTTDGERQTLAQPLTAKRATDPPDERKYDIGVVNPIEL